MFSALKMFKVQRQVDHKNRIRQSREAKLNRIRTATAGRESIKRVLAKEHGVSPRRIVLMDRAMQYVGRGFTGRYVIKNRVGLNTKFNF